MRAVVGKVALDSGTVEVFGKEPGSKGHQIPGVLVGYMPQVKSINLLIIRFEYFGIEC